MSQSALTILLVDDSETDRYTVRRYLSRSPGLTYELIECESGAQALAQCRQRVPSCILLDYSLPDMDGLSLIATIQQEFGVLFAPLVLITGSGDEAIAVHAIKHGAQDYLVKGRMSPEILYLAIDNALRDLETQKTLAEQQQELRRQNEELLRRQSEIQYLNQRLQLSMIETHHRIKNNLQIISAMVELGAQEGNGCLEVKEVERLTNGLRALALVQDLLTQEAKGQNRSDTLSVREAVQRLLESYQQTTPRHHFTAELEEIRLPNKLGTSITMLANELLSNAVKYGHTQVMVWLSVLPDNRIELVVEDNGKGFPENFDPLHSSNTGLQLMMNIAQWDLNGELNFRNRPGGGARVSLHMPLVVAS